MKEGIGFSCPLSPSFSLSPLLPTLRPLSSQESSTPLYLYPTHPTPSQNLPLRRMCIFYQALRATTGPWVLHLNPELLRVGYLKGSQEEYLHWNTTALAQEMQAGVPGSPPQTAGGLTQHLTLSLQTSRAAMLLGSRRHKLCVSNNTRNRPLVAELWGTG